MTEHVGKHLGYYQLLRLLGRGGFASVYLGEHIHLKSLAAIKVLYTRLAEDLQEDFLNEARILARFSHPSIVRILDFGIDEDVPFLVMEYAPYGTLRQLHPRSARLPLVMVMNYVNQITDGLQYAHDQNLIHRDLKPDNVLIGQHGNLLLSDFGVALIAQTTSSHNPEGDFAGTAAYMAPEQLRGEPQLASDQYALGIMVYEWLCGKRPFRGTVVELYSQHSAVPPQPLREHVPDLPVEVEQIVLRALSKDPAERFPNVKTFAVALEQACRSMQGTIVRRAAPVSASSRSNAITPADWQTSNQSVSFTPETSQPLSEPSTLSSASAPPSTPLPNLPSVPHTEPSTSQAPLPAAQASISSSAQSQVLPEPPPGSKPSGLLLATSSISDQPIQQLSAQAVSNQPAVEGITGAKYLHKKHPGRVILLFGALILLVMLVAGSTTLAIFSQIKLEAADSTAPSARTAALRLKSTTSPSAMASTPAAFRTATGGTFLSNGSSSSSAGSLPVTSSSSPAGILTPTAQAQPTVGSASAPLPTPTAMAKPPAPTPTSAVQGCTTYNWSMSSATGSQTGAFTTSTGCSTVKVTLSSGLLTLMHITIRACTSSGCGSAQIALPGSTVTLLTNVSPGTSFYLKTTSALSLGTTLSGTVAC